MSEADLSGVLRPIEHAVGLPNAHYVSGDVFLMEREKLLFESWAGIGFAKDVPARNLKA